MTRCEKGHYFNEAKHPVCPFCRDSVVSVLDNTYVYRPPRPGDDLPGQSEPPPESEYETPPPLPDSYYETPPSHDSDPPTTHPIPPRGTTLTNSETVAYWGKRGFNPIVGWLVCIEGVEKGQDFQVRRGNNNIGRDRSMDIVLKDPGVARQRQAVIAYDQRTHTFMVKEGDSRGLVYLNGAPVASAAPLEAWDRLEFGDSRSTYLFIPLVGQHFRWQVDDDSASRSGAEAVESP